MPKSNGFKRHWLLAGTILTSMTLVGLPAFAQDTTQPAATQDTTKDKAAKPAPTDAPAADEPAAVVVTGSRIRNKTYTSSAPVQVITAEKSSLAGMVDPAQILQQSSVANGSGQINSTFTNYITTGGAGINTLSLRGLGDNRTLILINGRRMPPAGVSGSVGPVDLSFIPQEIVSRYEILTDGASSIYGSDAVAGVVNIITDKNYDGFQITAEDHVSEKKGGDERQISAKWGKTFDKGSFLVAGSYYEQLPLTLADRKSLACPQRLRYKADGTRADTTDPRTGDYKCYNASGLFQGSVYDNITGDIYFYTHDLGTNDPTAPAGYTRYNGSNAVYEYDNPQEALNTTAISPNKRVSVFAQGNWRPDWLHGAEAYTEMMFGERKSTQTAWGELFPYYSGHAAANPLPNTFDPNDYYGYGPKQPYAQPVVLHPSNSSQKVDLARVLGGLRGDLGTWQWDTYLSYSKSVGKYDDDVTYADRIDYGTGLNQRTFQDIGVCGAGAPAGCVPLNLFTDDALLRGKLTPAEEAYYFTVDHGKTDYTQMIGEATITGDLFQLPAGALSTALGVSFRTDKINDVPGELSRSGNSYNRTSSGITKGDDTLSEAFGELEVPVFKNVPFIQKFTLDLSGRYSDYKSVGGASTYKAGFQWNVDDTLMLRGTAGTSYRGPALYELYLKDQTGYLDQTSVDPCINYDQIIDGEPKANATVRANCLADGVPGNYTGSNPSAVITTGGGLDLKPETSYATTVGFVLTPPGTGVKFAMDFWKIKISNQITSDGAAVIYACYNSPQFRSQPGFCDDFTRDMNPNSTTKHAILTIDGSYRNIPTEATAGIDFNLNYDHTFNFGTLSSQAQFTYYKYLKSQQYEGAEVIDYTGTIGNQHWTGDVQTTFTHKDWTIAWTLNYVGNASNIGFFGETGANAAQTYTYAASVPPFVTHDLSVRYRAKNFTVVAGVDNLLNKYAPTVGAGLYSGSASRLGEIPFSSQYEAEGLIGRQFFVRVSKDF